MHYLNTCSQNDCNRNINTLTLVLISVTTVIKVKVTGDYISKNKEKVRKIQLIELRLVGERSFISQ